jgi:hypothetical protein
MERINRSKTMKLAIARVLSIQPILQSCQKNQQSRLIVVTEPKVL